MTVITPPDGDAQGRLVGRPRGGLLDLHAEHPDGRLMYVEAKGHTTSPDVDTVYGQLLRRMKSEEAHARYAVVVPTSVLKAAQRVPPTVRETLRIDLFTVDEAGLVSSA